MVQRIIGSDLLIKLAGKDAYQRGLTGYSADKISSFSQEGDKVEGTVAGKLVSLRYIGDSGDLIEGQCSCPESDGFDFCQHCVQLTLYANKRTQQLLSLSKGPDKSKVLAYLLGLDKHSLAKEMLGMLEQNAELFERYLLRASLSTEQIDFVNLRARMTDLTRIDDKRNLFSQRQVKAFFAKLDQLTAELDPILVSHPHEGLKLVEYALKRLNNLLSQLDDKWGLHHVSAERLADLYRRLYSAQEGRALTRVKRFEKLYFTDRVNLLGEASSNAALVSEHLSSVDGGFEIFTARVQAVWLSEYFPKEYAQLKKLAERADQSELEKAWLNSFSEIKLEWQWRKLARFLNELGAPKQLKLSNFEWQQSLNKLLFTSALSWLEWIGQIQQDYGRDLALHVAREAYAQYPQSEALVKRLVELELSAQNDEQVLSLARRQPKAVVDLILEKNMPFRALPKDLLSLVYRAVDGINPHDDPEEKQYQALITLVQIVEQRFDKTLAHLLAQDERLLIDDRIKILKQMDEHGETTLAKSVRETMIPFLLAKNQNRSDDLAAEQTVLLQKNYRALGLDSERFDSYLHGFAYLIQKRTNFIGLVQKHRR